MIPAEYRAAWESRGRGVIRKIKNEDDGRILRVTDACRRWEEYLEELMSSTDVEGR